MAKDAGHRKDDVRKAFLQAKCSKPEEEIRVFFFQKENRRNIGYVHLVEGRIDIFVYF